MIQTILAAAAVALALAATPAAARTAAPGGITASYNVLLNGGHIAVMNEQFETRDNRYHIVSESTPVGLFALFQRRPAKFVSSGSITGRGLQPERFEGSRGADDARRVSAEFDWAGTRLTLRHDGRNDSVELPVDTQDRLSIMYQFMFFGYEQRKQLDFTMTNGRKLDRYYYAITPDVEIDTPLGRTKTLHLVKQREAGDTATEIWLAPQHGYLPVKMLIVEKDGSRYEQIITRLDFKP